MGTADELLVVVALMAGGMATGEDGGEGGRGDGAAVRAALGRGLDTSGGKMVGGGKLADASGDRGMGGTGLGEGASTEGVGKRANGVTRASMRMCMGTARKGTGAW